MEINKDKMGLGLSIVGGSDTLLVSVGHGTATRPPQHSPDTFCAAIVCVAGSDNNTRGVSRWCCSQGWPPQTRGPDLGGEQ